MSITHLYSDPHFGHANIIKHANRPFRDIEEMNAEFIRRYRAVVGDDDTVLWVGDCSLGKPGIVAKVLRKLPGSKWLVRGNHDSSARKMCMLGFDFVAEQIWIPVGGQPVLVCHYPPLKAKYTGREHDDRYKDRRPIPVKGQIYIHGHTHETNKRVGNRIHVGVDAWGYAPVSIGEIEELLKQ